MPRKLRLDQILLQLGYVTDADLQEALRRQRMHGGRIGAALMYSRRLTEKQLVEALAQQFEISGVVISELDILDELLRLIPKRVMRSRLALPFDYNPNDNVLSVAVADPEQPGLLEELGFVARGKTVRIYVACELALKTALARYLDGDEATIESKMSLQFPDELLSDNKSKEQEKEDTPSNDPRKEHILVLTNEEFSAPLVRSILERSGAQVVVVPDITALQHEIKSQNFTHIYLQRNLVSEPDAFRARLRTLKRQAAVKWFTTCHEWLTEGPQSHEGSSLSQSYTTILRSLIEREHSDSASALNVDRCVRGICDRLYIQLEEQDEVCFLAHLYLVGRTLGRFSDGDTSREDFFTGLADFAETANLPAVFANSLRNCYKPLLISQLSGDTSNSELYGNILTALDISLKSLAGCEKLTLDTFDTLRSELNSHAGSLLLPDVVDSLLLSVQSAILDGELANPRLEALVFCGPGASALPAQEMQLRTDGIRVVNVYSISDLQKTISRRRPDALILALSAAGDGFDSTLEQFAATDIDFHTMIALVVTDSDKREELEKLYRAGVNDVLTTDTSPQLLSAKISTLVERASKSREVAKSQAGEARGDLSQMNLIDLIQAMGPSRKTVRITVDNNDSQLTLYMLDGKMVYAKLGDINGPEAIFEGVQWQSGEFVVSRTRVTEIPSPNIELPNESILMEGCRLMDEELRDS